MADWEVIYRATADFAELRTAAREARDDLKKTQQAVREESEAEVAGAEAAARANDKDTEAIKRRTRAMEEAVAVARAYDQAQRGSTGADSAEKRIADLARERDLTQQLMRARQRGYATPAEDYAQRQRETQQVTQFNRAAWGGAATKDQYIQGLSAERREMDALNQSWARRAAVIRENANAVVAHGNAASQTSQSLGQLASAGSTPAQAAVTKADQDLSQRIAQARSQLSALRTEITSQRITPTTTGADDVLAQAEKIRKSIRDIGDDYEKLGLRPTGIGKLTTEFDSVKAYASRSLKGIESDSDEAAHGITASFRGAGTAISDVWARFRTGAQGALADSSELESGFNRVIRAIGAGLQGAAGNGGIISFLTQLGGAFSGFGEGAAASIGPLTAGVAALIQFLPALAAGLGAVVTVLAAAPAAITAAAGALGVYLSAIEPVIQALSAYSKYLDAAQFSASKNIAAQQQAAQTAHALSDAQFALTQAYVQGANTQLTAAHGVADAEYNLKQARFASAQAAIQQAHAVGDAQFALSQAYKAAAIQQVESQLSVSGAFHSLRDSQFAVTQAQFQLNQTWIQAQRSLQDLEIQVSAAGLNLRGAQLNLEQAQQSYAQTMANATSTALDRAQAAYQIQQAEFALRQVELTNARNEQDLANVRKYGASQVYGVTAAQHSLIDAQYAEITSQKQLAITQKQAANAQIVSAHEIKDAVFALSQAYVSQRESGVTSAHNIAEAQFALQQAQFQAAQAAVTSGHQISDAQYAVAQAAYAASFGTSAAASAYAQYQELLASNINSGWARRFITQAQPLLKWWNDLSVTQDNFFKQLDSAIPATAAEWKPLEDSLSTFLGTVATALGKGAAGIARWLQAFVESPAFTQILTPATGQIISDLAASAEDFAKAFGEIAIAAAPFAEWLSGKFLGLANEFLAWVDSSVQSGTGFVAWIRDAEKILPSLADVLGAIVKWFGILATAGLPEAVPLFEALARQVLPLLFQILIALARPELLNALIGLVIAVERLLLAVAKGPLLTAFLGTLTVIAKVLADIASNKLAAPVLDALGAALGGLIALRVLTGLGRVVTLMKDIYTWGRAAASAIGTLQAGGSLADAMAVFSAFKARAGAAAATGAAESATGAAAGTVAAESGAAASEAALAAGETGIAGAGAAGAAAIGGIGAAAGAAGILVAGLGYSIYGLIKAYHDQLPPIKATVAGYREYVQAASDAQRASGTGWVGAVEKGFAAAGNTVVTHLGEIQSEFGLTRGQAEALAVKAGVAASSLAATGTAGQNSVNKVLAFGNSMATAAGYTQELGIKLTPVIQGLGGLSSNLVQSQIDALQFQQQEQQVAAQLAQTSGAISGNSEAAVSNREAVLQLTQQAIALANQQLTVQGNVKGASRTIADQITFLRTAEGHTTTFASEIHALRAEEDKLRGIIRTDVRVTGQGKWDVGGMSGKLASLFAHGFSGGGYISQGLYGGVSGQDSVPALLMPDEYVQRSSAVAAYGVDAMDAVNEGRAVISYARGGYVPSMPGSGVRGNRFAYGGMVTPHIRRFADGGPAFSPAGAHSSAVTGDFSGPVGGLGHWLARQAGATAQAFGAQALVGSIANAMGIIGPFSGLTGAKGYANPLRGVIGLAPERIDMGVDYAGSGPVYALGPGIVTEADHAWIGAVGAPFPGTFIKVRLASGPLAGREVYTAEDLSIRVRAGQAVDSGTVIGVMAGGIETGFALPGANGVTMAAATGQASSSGDPGANETAYGAEYSAILASLGAPAGIGHGRIVGTAPPLGSGAGKPRGFAAGGPVADAIRAVARGRTPAERAVRYGMGMGSWLWTHQDPQFAAPPLYGAFAINRRAYPLPVAALQSPWDAAMVAYPVYSRIAHSGGVSLGDAEQAARIVGTFAQAELTGDFGRGFSDGAAEQAFDIAEAEFGPDVAGRHRERRTIFGREDSTGGPWSASTARLGGSQEALIDAVQAILRARRGHGWHEYRRRHGKHKGQIAGVPRELHRLREALGRSLGREETAYAAVRSDEASRITILPSDQRAFRESLAGLGHILGEHRLEGFLPGDTRHARRMLRELEHSLRSSEQLWDRSQDSGRLPPDAQWDRYRTLLAQAERSEGRDFAPIRTADVRVEPTGHHHRGRHRRHVITPAEARRLTHRLTLAREVFRDAQEAMWVHAGKITTSRSPLDVTAHEWRELDKSVRHLEDLSGIIRHSTGSPVSIGNNPDANPPGGGGGQGSPSGRHGDWNVPAIGLFRQREHRELHRLIGSLREMGGYESRAEAAWRKIKAAQPRYRPGPPTPGPGDPRAPKSGSPGGPLSGLFEPGVLGGGIVSGSVFGPPGRVSDPFPPGVGGFAGLIGGWPKIPGGGGGGGTHMFARGGFAGGSMRGLDGAFSAHGTRMALGGLVAGAGAGRMMITPAPRSVSQGAAVSGAQSGTGGRGGITIGSIEINNPVRESAGQSLTAAVQRAAFLAGRGE